MKNQLRFWVQAGAVLFLGIFASACAHSSGANSSGSADSKNYSGHGIESLSAETLKRFAPTPLPPELSRRIQTLLDVRSPGMGVLSPDAKSLYFSWSVTGVPQVWRLDSPKGFPTQLTAGEDMTLIDDVTPDGKKLILTRDRNGEENPGLYWQSPAGGPLHLIQHQSKVQSQFAFISDDSRFVYYRSNDLKPDAYAIYRYDLAAEKKELVFSETGLWAIADYKKDGHLLLAKETGARTTEYSEWDPVTHLLKPILGQDSPEEYSVSYGAHPDEFLVLTPKLSDFRRLYSYKAGKFSPISPEMQMDVSSFEVDHLHQHIVTTTNQSGYTRIQFFDARTYKPIQSKAIAALAKTQNVVHLRPGRITLNGRYLTVSADLGKVPPANYVFDWKTQKLTQWVLPSAPEVDLSQFTSESLESYPAQDGTPIPMFVRRPKKCATLPCPVIVNFHGGPEGQSLPGFSPVSQFFLEAGFVLVYPNVRGSDGYGKKWLESDNGPKRLQVITDIRDCATYIRSHWTDGGKAPKIGIMGGSYGGYSTLIGMTMFAGSYDAGVAIVGMSNLVTFLENTAPYRRILRTTEYGDPVKDHDALVQLSPITHIQKVVAPLLIIQGANDPRVPAGEAIQMEEALTRRNIPHSLILFPDEGHGAGKRSNRALELGHSLEFFQRYLLAN